MKIAIIRGGNLNKWDMACFEKLNKSEEIVAIGSIKSRYDLSKIALKKKLLFRGGLLFEWMKYPSVLINYLLGFNDYLMGLNSVLADAEVVEASDTIYYFTYQAVKAHNKVVCNCFENIPFFKEFGVSKSRKEYIRKNAAHFIAVTEKAKSVLELEGVPSDKITVIPPGIDTDLFKPRDKDASLLKKYKLNAEDVNILFTGRLVYDKGIEDLLYAFVLLKKDFKNLNLLILGNGPLKKKIVSLAEKYGVIKSIRFLGFVDYTKTYKYYNLADIFCTPSRITKYWQEQFGFVFAEALASGVPIVSTHAGSIPEVTGGNALLVSPGNHLELYFNLKKLIENKALRNQLSTQGRAFAVETYSANVIAKKRLGVYKKVLYK